MTTDDFTDDAIEAILNFTDADIRDSIPMHKVMLVKVIVGDEPDPAEIGVEFEISTDPYDLGML